MPKDHRNRIAALIVTFTLAACADPSAISNAGEPEASGRQGTANAAPCEPIETRSPNAARQQPTFPEQTRACEETTDVEFDLTVLADGLTNPWAVEPLPDGDLLVTEKPGRMRIVTASGSVGEPIRGVPEVDARGQGGLLDVALSPDFARDRMVYWSYTEPRRGGNGTSVPRGTLSQDRRSLEGVRVIFRARPTYDGRLHYGSRLAFGPDGKLFVTLGERSDREIRPQAQHPDSQMGKIVRINPDGSVPNDNPFVDESGTLPEIWTFGHRNLQSAAFDDQGRLWAIEHGPRGGDELNLIEKEKNYGWPLVTFGEEYSGDPVQTAETTRPGYVDPVYYWDPVIAPSGMEIHSGDFPEWEGSIFVGGLVTEALVRLSFDGDRVTGEEHLLGERGQRVRDVREGAGGVLYVVTDESDGELWKITPRAE
ncbi:MAG: PQQ-dependent sugar dehydrogenase [Acidobacteria bacterium]|nr:PQQ-dependent sugar dehydrogenase [Acidobacteriota bacterium]